MIEHLYPDMLTTGKVVARGPDGSVANRREVRWKSSSKRLTQVNFTRGIVENSGYRQICLIPALGTR